VNTSRVLAFEQSLPRGERASDNSRISNIQGSAARKAEQDIKVATQVALAISHRPIYMRRFSCRPRILQVTSLIPNQTSIAPGLHSRRSLRTVSPLPQSFNIMAPIAVDQAVEAPVAPTTTKAAVAAPALSNGTSTSTTTAKTPAIARYDANDPATTTELLVSIIERDGGVIVENIISQELAGRIKTELKPYFDTDKVDPSGFFPETTQRATGLFARSDACVELAMNKTYIDVANAMLSSTYTYWNGQVQETVTSKPIISSTVGFRVNPGGRQQALHRDDG